jgi:pimeloyl-ACP methyl ester carboxylesterase
MNPTSIKEACLSVEQVVLERLQFLLRASEEEVTDHGPKPQESYVKTADGWNLAVYHYSNPKSRHVPVVLMHGLGTNRYDVDFIDSRYSLAKYLYKKGFDVWFFEYRGSGKSYRSGLFQKFKDRYQPNWILDDIVFTDIPMAVHYIQNATGHKKLHFVGHSLGGMLLYMMLMTMGNGICKSAVTLGASMNSTAKPGWIRLLLKLDWFLELFPLIPAKSLLTLGSPFISWLAPLEDNHMYSIQNVNPSLLKKIGRYATENIPMPLFMELHRWYKKGHFAAETRDFSFHKHLKDIRVPILAIGGSVDGITPLPDVRYAYDQISSKQKKFVEMGTPGGHPHEYAHMDLVLGTHAPKEVYPQILAWLKKYDKKSTAKSRS